MTPIQYDSNTIWLLYNMTPIQYDSNIIWLWKSPIQYDWCIY